MNNTYIAIMAGGVGSRFWPGSREARPKQFLDILNIGKTLLQMTYERNLALCPKENMLIVTNKIYKNLVLEQLPDLTADQVLCEPSRNNTAPCLAYAAFKLQQKNPNAVMLVAASDHLVTDTNEYTRRVSIAVDFAAKNDALMTLGLTPSRPDTGYGYIRFTQNETTAGVHKVVQFTEKPDQETAKKMVDSGEYVWNSGMFVWQAASFIKQLNQFAPDIFEIFQSIESQLNTATEQDAIDTYYPKTRNISVDFAVMEKAQNVYTVPSDFGWSDLGTWGSLHSEAQKDEFDNAVQSDNAHLYDTANNLIRVPKHKLVVIKGLEGFIVVDEGDILLICPKDQEQEIKQITNDLKAAGKSAFL
jgi:mannose-1-phosphate guanylyltransferase